MKIKNWYFGLGIGVVFIYLLPLFILGENAHILIHDNLDSNHVWLKILAESGKIFSGSNTLILNMFNGLPRGLFESEFNLILYLHFLFSPFKAYVINLVIMRLVAFGGMYLLLSQIFSKNNFLISAGGAVCFALLPFWPYGGLSIAGQPLLAFCFYKIVTKKNYWPYLFFIFIFPFYSSFVLAGVFILFFLGIFFFYNLILTKKINYPFLFACLIFFFVYLLVNYRLIDLMFFSENFVSHRTEHLRNLLSFKEAILLSIYNFIYGQYHAHSIQYPVILTSVWGALMLNLTDLVKKKDKLSSNAWFWLILLTIILISIFYGFWDFSGWEFLKNKINLLRSFNFNRVHWLHPFLWSILFVISLLIIQKNIYKKFATLLIAILILGQILVLFKQNDEIQFRQNFTYKQFYSSELFRNIQAVIHDNPQNYKVVSIGLHPAIAQYNGFYTLDGYFANYPLKYKTQFRKIIQPELAKDRDLMQYYDNWGNRAYVFSADLGKNFLITTNDDFKIHSLDLNYHEIKRMGGKYILSAVKIENLNPMLKLVRVFENTDSLYKIYLYRIN